MAARLLLQRRAAAPLTATLLAGGIVLYPAVAHAEAPVLPRSRKSIYDDIDAPSTPPTSLVPVKAAPTAPESATRKKEPPATTPSEPEPEGPIPVRGPSPTDRLAGQIRIARLFLYRQAGRAEDAVNAGMDRAFDLEQSFTSTVASLAPPRESGERLMPGLIYVLVAAMAGSIVTRNRNVVFRAAGPLALGVGAAWTVLPVTMGNVSDLAWQYEQRFPAVADAHRRTREGVEGGWRSAKAQGDFAVRKVDETVSEARQAVESWVKKGK